MSKEEEKTQNVNKVGSSISVTVSLALFLVGQKVDSLAHHGDELGQLHKSQRGLPPDGKVLSGLGHLGVHADEVVSVHDGVDESVQYDSEVYISIVLSLGVNPVEEEDGEMMVYVKEGKLSPLLSEYDKDGIPEIPDLGNVEEPKEVGHGRVLLVVRITADAVSLTVCDHSSLDGHVCTEEDLGYVVEELDGVWVDGGYSSLHDGGSDKDEGYVCECNGDCGAELGECPSL